MKKFVIVFCTIVYSCFQCYAQITRDTILLKGIEVHASPMVRFSVGSIPDLIKTGNSNDPVNSQLGDFIQCNSNAIVRQASFGSSSSISLRGSSAGQVAVMWNGFNVNSPSLGTMDVSLIPFESGNEITIYNSGMSPHSGQTGLGGLLEINFNPNFSENEIFRLSTSYGDFETIESKLKFRYAGKRFLSESNVFYTASENNYTYRNVALADQPIESLDHSRYTYGGLIQNFQYKIDAKNTFQGGIWIQRTNRDLPAPMTIPKSNAVQNDSTMRSFVSYQRGSETKNIKIGFAYFDERQHFADPDVLVDSRHRNRQYQGELSTTQRLPADVLIRIGIKTEFQKSDIA